MSSAVHVRTPAGVEAAARSLSGGGDVAVDCEAAGFHRYSDRICLVQISTRRDTFVLDPLAVELGAALKPVLEDAGRRVIMHGASYDLRLLMRDVGVGVANLFDTQVAAALAGEPAVGLQALLKRHLGVHVSKKHQRADWARRPLPPEMIEYAAGDTRHLHRLAAELEDALRRLGRTAWAVEECRRMLDAVRTEEAAGAGSGTSGACRESRATAGPVGGGAGPGLGPEEDPVVRVKGARRLDPRSATALRRALEWRDRVARAIDRAPFRVASDATLMAVATERPLSAAALAATKGFPKGMARTRGRSLVEALAQVERTPEQQLKPYPAAATRGRGRPPPEEEAAFERLKAARDRAAERLGLDRGRLMANGVLRRVAAAKPRSLRELEGLDEVRRWQARELGEELLRAV